MKILEILFMWVLIVNKPCVTIVYLELVLGEGMLFVIDKLKYILKIVSSEYYLFKVGGKEKRKELFLTENGFHIIM